MSQWKTGFCKRGHKIEDSNIYTAPGTGIRACRTCLNQRTYRWTRLGLFGGLREEVIQRDGEKCVECGMTRKEHFSVFSKDITVDHIDGKGR